jgi:hypothetical protein
MVCGEKGSEPLLSWPDQRRLLDEPAYQQLNGQSLITLGIYRECWSRTVTPSAITSAVIPRDPRRAQGQCE